MPVSREGARTGPVEDQLGSVAVVFDLVQPIVADRRRLDLDGLENIPTGRPSSTADDQCRQ